MKFDEIGLGPRLVSRLAGLGLTEPTPIQAKAIPHALQGRDVLGIAQTGTGKTAAFAIPLVVALSKSQQRPAPKSARGLILVPTRELGDQIVQSLQGFTADLRITLVVGGRSINVQSTRLARGTDILVATPGRLLDLMNRQAVDLGATRFLVVDEADQMLDLGFGPALRRIASALGGEHQTMMFSATMPKAMADLSRDYLTDELRVEVSSLGKVPDKVVHSVHFVPEDRKPALLVDLMGGHRAESALVFARTKHGAERLLAHLQGAGFSATSIHGNKSQGQRDRAIAAFKSGSVRVLVATDVAARGIDIPDVRHVYNFDLPNVPENYIHRIGRTARAGRDGRAIAFCAVDEVAKLRAIEDLLGRGVAVAGGHPWKARTPELAKDEQRSRRRSGGRPVRMAA